MANRNKGSQEMEEEFIFKKCNPANVPASRPLEPCLIHMSNLIKNCATELKWNKFLRLNHFTFPRLVSEFYSNLKRKYSDPENTYRTSVRGKEIVISPSYLAELLETDQTGSQLKIKNDERKLAWYNQEYLGECRIKNDLHATLLPQKERIAHFLIVNYVLPKKGSKTFGSRFESCVLWHMLNKKKLNLPLLILGHMTKNSREKTCTYPYGSLITEIMLKEGIALPTGAKERIRGECITGEFLKLLTYRETKVITDDKRATASKRKGVEQMHKAKKVKVVSDREIPLPDDAECDLSQDANQIDEDPQKEESEQPPECHNAVRFVVSRRADGKVRKTRPVGRFHGRTRLSTKSREAKLVNEKPAKEATPSEMNAYDDRHLANIPEREDVVLPSRKPNNIQKLSDAVNVLMVLHEGGEYEDAELGSRKAGDNLPAPDCHSTCGVESDQHQPLRSDFADVGKIARDAVREYAEADPSHHYQCTSKSEADEGDREYDKTEVDPSLTVPSTDYFPPPMNQQGDGEDDHTDDADKARPAERNEDENDNAQFNVGDAQLDRLIAQSSNEVTGDGGEVPRTNNDIDEADGDKSEIDSWVYISSPDYSPPPRTQHGEGEDDNTDVVHNAPTAERNEDENDSAEFTEADAQLDRLIAQLSADELEEGGDVHQTNNAGDQAGGDDDSRSPIKLGEIPFEQTFKSTSDNADTSDCPSKEPSGAENVELPVSDTEIYPGICTGNERASNGDGARTTATEHNASGNREAQHIDGPGPGICKQRGDAPNADNSNQLRGHESVEDIINQSSLKRKMDEVERKNADGTKRRTKRNRELDEFEPPLINTYDKFLQVPPVQPAVSSLTIFRQLLNRSDFDPLLTEEELMQLKEDPANSAKARAIIEALSHIAGAADPVTPAVEIPAPKPPSTTESIAYKEELDHVIAQLHALNVNHKTCNIQNYVRQLSTVQLSLVHTAAMNDKTATIISHQQQLNASQMVEISGLLKELVRMAKQEEEKRKNHERLQVQMMTILGELEGSNGVDSELRNLKEGVETIGLIIQTLNDNICDLSRSVDGIVQGNGRCKGRGGQNI